MVKFNSLSKYAFDHYPIKRAKDSNFEWVETARNNFLESSSPNISKCPGIFSVMGLGWIQYSHRDIYINTNGDGVSINHHIPSKFRSEFSHDSVELHGPDQLSDFIDLGENTLKTIVKIGSPWWVEIPKGYSLLCMPVAYSGETKFTAATGILRGKMPLHVQLYWHHMNGTAKIKQGTPLNQLILLKDGVQDYDVGYIDDAYSYIEIDENGRIAKKQ